jgi:hypothetical protein
MEIEDPGGPLSDLEFRELVRLLARYAERELDQADRLKFHTSYGPVYMLISRELPYGWPDETDKSFTTIWPLPVHLHEVQHENGNQQE